MKKLLPKILILWVLMFVNSGAGADSALQQLAKQLNLEGRIMWFDADANLWELSTREGVASTIAKCKAARINTIIVDIKPLSGYVLYNSKIAPKLKQFLGKTYPKDYDLLKTVIEEGHKAGIRVHAAMNIFSEGSQKVPGGPAFFHPDWQCIHYWVDRKLRLPNGELIEVNGSNTDFSKCDVCVYKYDMDNPVSLPKNTAYVRIDSQGMPVQSGRAEGRATISAPPGGYVLVGINEAGEKLLKMSESGVKFEYEMKPSLLRTDKLPNVHHAVFLNPGNPAVATYELSLIEEVCKNYPIDGIVMDRMRYPNIYADFSDLSREQFEKFIGKKVENWPEDIFVRGQNLGNDVIPGPLFGDWLKFRAGIIRNFFSEVRRIVKSARPNALLGVYVGSWYPAYYDVGVNWGSRKNKANYDWWPEGYEETGYADIADYICTGCYYLHPTREDARAAGEPEWKSVEAAAEESVNAIKDDAIVYGSLYLYQYKNRPDLFIMAVQQCLKNTQGCMLFDLVYVRNYDWWEILKYVFPESKIAPHDSSDIMKSFFSK